MEIIVGKIGQYGLYLAILLTWVVFFINWKFQNRNKRLVEMNLPFNTIAAVLLWLSFIILVYAFIDRDYRYITVYSYSDNTMSLTERIMATWASRPGVMILWSALLTSISLGVLYYLKDELPNPIVSRTLTILYFFSALIATFTLFSRPGPFDTGSNFSDGLGLTPALLSIWQEIHPPVAFMSYATFIVPYSIGLSIISLKRKDIIVPPKLFWLNDLFMMLGWGLTSIFMVAGSIWAYEENWAGFWAWDPIEIATLVLWLVSTLYFHVKTHVRKNHLLQSLSAVLGWIAVTFASFVVRGGLDGYHSYAGAARAIVFALLFLGSTSGLVYALIKSNEEILPEKIFNWRKSTNKVNLATFWVLTLGIAINVVGLFTQIFNALILGESDIPYAYYIPLNALIFFSLTILLVLCEMKPAKLTLFSKLVLIDGTAIFVFIVLYFILADMVVLYMLSGVIASSFFILAGLTIRNLFKIKNFRRLGIQLIHLTMILMIFSYFTVDMGSIQIDEVIIPDESKYIDELKLTINATRIEGKSFPQILVSICEEDNHLGNVIIQQGYHLGNYWKKGGWLTINFRDIYITLQSGEMMELSKDAPILLEINSKPLTYTFHIVFYLLVFVTVIGVYSTMKMRPKGGK